MVALLAAGVVAVIGARYLEHVTRDYRVRQAAWSRFVGLGWYERELPLESTASDVLHWWPRQIYCALGFGRRYRMCVERVGWLRYEPLHWFRIYEDEVHAPDGPAAALERYNRTIMERRIHLTKALWVKRYVGFFHEVMTDMLIVGKYRYLEGEEELQRLKREFDCDWLTPRLFVEDVLMAYEGRRRPNADPIVHVASCGDSDGSEAICWEATSWLVSSPGDAIVVEMTVLGDGTVRRLAVREVWSREDVERQCRRHSATGS